MLPPIKIEGHLGTKSLNQQVTLALFKKILVDDVAQNGKASHTKIATDYEQLARNHALFVKMIKGKNDSIAATETQQNLSRALKEIDE